jgi:hypothetical protein
VLAECFEKAENADECDVRGAPHRVLAKARLQSAAAPASSTIEGRRSSSQFNSRSGEMPPAKNSRVALASWFVAPSRHGSPKGECTSKVTSKPLDEQGGGALVSELRRKAQEAKGNQEERHKVLAIPIGVSGKEALSGLPNHLDELPPAREVTIRVERGLSAPR